MRAGFVCVLLAVSAAACGKAPTPTSPSPTAAARVETIVDVPLVSVTEATVGTWNYPGQSVTIPGGAYNNIRFNWYTHRRESAAFGTLYILSQEYLGLPRDLASAAGLVGRAASTGSGEYVFAPDVTLNGGTTYWFYGDAQGAFVTSFDLDLYRGGDLYVTGIHSAPFRKVPASGRMVEGRFVPGPAGVFTDANFKLQGTPK